MQYTKNKTGICVDGVATMGLGIESLDFTPTRS